MKFPKKLTAKRATNPLIEKILLSENQDTDSIKHSRWSALQQALNQIPEAEIQSSERLVWHKVDALTKKTQKAKEEKVKQSKYPVKFKLAFASIAFLLLISFTVVLYQYPFPQQNPQQYSTAQNFSGKDITIDWLSGSFSADQNELKQFIDNSNYDKPMEIHLEQGSGDFQFSRIVQFTINHTLVKIKVTGTKFFIDLQKDKGLIKLQQGRLEIFYRKNPTAIQLSGGESLKFDLQNFEIIRKIIRPKAKTLFNQIFYLKDGRHFYGNVVESNREFLLINVGNQKIEKILRSEINNTEFLNH